MKKNSSTTLKCLLATLLVWGAVSCRHQANEMIYKNPEAAIEDRVDDLLSRMTLEEKFWQLFMIPGDLSDGKEKYKHGIFGFQVATSGSSGNATDQIPDHTAGGTARETALLINEIQKYFVEETRLGIPIIPFDEALHGLIRENATAFPQAIGLAASWDTKLMDSVAIAIASEMRARGIRQNLSPVINIARDVRWGRTEETYGEDPFLTAQMAVAYVSAFEKRGVITTPKHFVANVGDGGRDSYPIHFNERILEEIYFPAFKASIQAGGAGSIMTAYNSLDGRPASANGWLLREKLKKEWGFDGFVISDAGATGGANVLHFTAKDYPESTRQAIENGLDVIFQTSYDHYPLFYEAFERGLVSKAAIDEAVSRVLHAKFRLGLFEDPYVNMEAFEKNNDFTAHKALAKKAALESVVLLKNEGQILPIKKDIRSIAVIGTDAAEARLGGYSGPGNLPVSLIQGLKNQLGEKLQLLYAPGCGRSAEDFVAIPADRFFHLHQGSMEKGLSADYFNNIELEGEPAMTRIDTILDFSWTLYSPDQQKINYDHYSVRWTGKLLASQTGNFKIGIEGDDGYRLYLDDELILDNWTKQGFRKITASYAFEKDKSYDIKVEFYETAGNVRFKLIWNVGVENDWQKEIEAAVALARETDLTILCAGIEEGEFRDRAILSLPGHQEELIKKVADTGKPVVVVLYGGSAITMTSWIQHVPAILDAWYPGEEGGNAVAEILFGKYNPAGRLPISFPLHEGQLPLYYNHKPTGRGDDYVNLSGKPLFPFGFGLSYTKFEYSDIALDQNPVSEKDTVTVRCKITNTGDYDGDEVVQLYIKDLYASVARPVLELKGFKRIQLKKGETREVRFEISSDMLTMLNEQLDPVIEAGEFRIMIGASSNDLRLRTTLKIE